MNHPGSWPTRASCVLAVCLFVVDPVAAQKLSFDTTPVSVTIAPATYRIPRNYLTHTGQIPALKLTWPGLEPLTQETQRCFGSIAKGEQSGCGSIEFLLFGSSGPGPGGLALTNKEKFENFKKYFPSSTSRRGPFGYDIYELGPETARIERYRRDDGDIWFTCSPHHVCDDWFRLSDMNHMQFFFRRPDIEHVPEIEARMRKMMESFSSRVERQ